METGARRQNVEHCHSTHGQREGYIYFMHLCSRAEELNDRRVSGVAALGSSCHPVVKHCITRFMLHEPSMVAEFNLSSSFSEQTGFIKIIQRERSWEASIHHSVIVFLFLRRVGHPAWDYRTPSLHTNYYLLLLQISAQSGEKTTFEIVIFKCIMR